MCSRYSFTVKDSLVEQQFGLNTNFDPIPNYNISAGQKAYIITNEQPRKLERMVWGLIPHWSNDGTNTGKLINARIEGIRSSTSFRLPIRQKRCLVLADSYYDWKQEGLKKWPYRIVAPGQSLMVMAGIWDEWQNSKHIVRSFSIITLPAQGEVENVSNRMPLILFNKALQDRWLQDIDLDAVFEVIKNNTIGLLKCYPISQKVNIAGFNSKELHEELAS